MTSCVRQTMRRLHDSTMLPQPTAWNLEQFASGISTLRHTHRFGESWQRGCHVLCRSGADDERTDTMRDEAFTLSRSQQYEVTLILAPRAELDPRLIRANNLFSTTILVDRCEQVWVWVCTELWRAHYRFLDGRGIRRPECGGITPDQQ